MSVRKSTALAALAPILLGIGAGAAAAQEGGPPARVAFIGLHGGVFDHLREFARDFDGLDVEYIPDRQIADESVDLSAYRLVFIQHVREEDRDAYRSLFLAAKQSDPPTRIFAVGREGSGAAEFFRDQGDANPVEIDETIGAYLPRSRENLRRFLIYISVKYLGQPGEILPPAEPEADAGGPYHPDREGRFDSVGEFLEWSKGRGFDPAAMPRAAVMVHRTHLEYQQPRVVDALVRAFEAEGVIAAGFTDGGGSAAEQLPELKPDVVVHTCHSGEAVEYRTGLDVPHLHSLFFRRYSIDHWWEELGGFTPGDAAFQVIGQEHLGAIEPLIGAGTEHGGGGAEAFSPIPERIDHLIGRALSWIRLRRTDHAEKRVAFLYYDREAGQNELMRGSATGMHLHAPRSMVKLLGRMRDEGYTLSDVPEGEDELIGWLRDRGRQYGLWNQADLDRLAERGQAVLLPVSTYLEWFERRVPEPARAAVLERWGPAPGAAMVWRDSSGQPFIVIPRIDLGNVVLLPQPLRGEGQDPSLLHSGLEPPPHNYIATYFWIEEAFGADAMVHFGTHGSEFFLPANPVGLNDRDWPDILMGTTPNINPWIIDNTGEAAPVKRRAYGLTIGHLTPPIVSAGLSDDLLNLHGLVDKWAGLEEGALRETFRRQITADVARLHLAAEADLPELDPAEPMTPEQIDAVVEYLHELEGETTPISLHVLGEPPREDLMIPFLTTILKRRFLEGLREVVEVSEEAKRLPGDDLIFLRSKAEEAVELVVRRGLSPGEAVVAIGGDPGDALPPDVQKGLELAVELDRNFAKTTDEIDNLLAAFDGRYIPPGPVNSPIRNPGAVPTGRNLYMLNPEEVPTRPSWEVGKTLVDQILERSMAEEGRYPEKIAFDLRPHATFRDFGVMEAQILHCLGVEPIWDDRDLVNDLRVVPAEEVGRPRIDVFIAPSGLYELNLPSRLELLDKAVRLVAELDEPENPVRANSERVLAELIERGIPADRAQALARARIFGYQPGEYGSASNFAFIQQSGSWTTRDEVIEHYLAQVKNVFTEDHWGEPAPEAFDRQIQGTDTVLRSWSDHMTGPLANKYMWLHGARLALAVEHLTGRRPEYLLSDVRDFDTAGMIGAEDALAREFRVRLFNRKWIEGMMKEGYSGADQMAVMTSNAMGWEVMREGSVPQHTWEQIDAIFVRDSLSLSIREWFEAENPFAFQEIAVTMLEAIRKGYWQADAETTLRLAESYARSVARHGDNGGFRTGGNIPLRQFVGRALANAGDAALAEVNERYQRRLERPPAPTGADPAPGQPTALAAIEPTPAAPEPEAAESEASEPEASEPEASEPEASEATEPSSESTEEAIRGQRLVASAPAPPPSADPPPEDRPRSLAGWFLAAVVLVLLGGGFLWRRSAA